MVDILRAVGDWDWVELNRNMLKLVANTLEFLGYGTSRKFPLIIFQIFPHLEH